MSLLCIQCSMRALLELKPPPTFDQTPEEHLASHHPDPRATQLEREALEERLREQVLDPAFFDPT